MMETYQASLVLRNGTTVGHEIALQASDDSLAFDTLAEVRAHLRDKKGDATPLLSLSTAGPATPGGSYLAISEATPSRLVLRHILRPGDTERLPADEDLGEDFELVWPSEDVDRPLRIIWITDGEWTHG
jgi:hypothetical protein